MAFQMYATRFFNVNGLYVLTLPMPREQNGVPTTNDTAPIGSLCLNSNTLDPYMIVRNVGTNTWRKIVTTDSGQAGLNGQLLIGVTNGAPQWNFLTSTGGSIVYTFGAGTINLETASSETVATVQTVDATPTALYTYAIPANTAVDVQVQLVGAKDDYTAGVSGTINIGATRGAGAAAIISTSQDAIVGEPIGVLATATGIISGNNLIIQVTGVVAETWNWRAIIGLNHFTI